MRAHLLLFVFALILFFPRLGYGRQGAPPDIPPNSELHFDVALKSINPPTRKEQKGGRKRQGSPPRR